MLVVLLLAVIAVSSYIVIVKRKKIAQKRRRLVAEHSLALRALRAVNQKYKFFLVPSFHMQHAYDNQAFFVNISPRDYLIYQLVYLQKKVEKAMADTAENHKLFLLYKNEIQTIPSFGKFDVEMPPKLFGKFLAIEQELFDATLLKPTVTFNIKVRLTLTTINGSGRAAKEDVFDANQIKYFLNMLKQKKGDFYTNDDIWQAICRVERGKVSNKMRFAIYNRDNYRCRKCGRKTDDLEVDHIFPISKGGKSVFENLQTLCHSCNALKSNTVEQGVQAWQTKRGFASECCAFCGAPLVLRKGKYGEFYGCSNYPTCKYTRKM